MKKIPLLIFCCIVSFLIQAQYSGITSQINNASRQDFQSLDSVVQFINKHSSNDYEKAYGAYYWIANNIRYDIKKYMRDLPSYSIPEDVFRKRKAVCIGYAKLYQYMCSGMQLNCKIVLGYSKGYKYKNGEMFTYSNHAWNAIQLDSAWQLIDVTWASGTLKKKLLGMRFIPRYSSDQFLVRPDLFVYKHIPQIPMWQLLNNPAPLKVFLSGNKKMELFLKSIPAPLFSFKDSIRSFLSKDSIQQTITEGEMALAFNALNTTPLAFAIIKAIGYQLSKDSLHLQNVPMHSIDSINNEVIKALALLKKARGSGKSFKKNIITATSKAHYISGIIYLFKSEIIRNNKPTSLNESFDSVLQFSKPNLQSLEKSVESFRKTYDKRTIRKIESILCASYISSYQSYNYFLEEEIDSNKKKIIQKEISAMVSQAKRKIPPSNRYYKALSKGFSNH